jgi:tetratricopeptide (TPR) repeat protein
VLRSASFVLLGVFLAGATSGLAQDSPSRPSAQPSASAQESDDQELSDQVVAAEAAIASADWKTAEAKLDPWLATHPTDARALFDAGYVADAQNRLDDAASLYLRATAANPSSFEAHLSLGLLLARQGKPAEARHSTAGRHQARPRRGGTVSKGTRLARTGRDRPSRSRYPRRHHCRNERPA